MNNNLKFLSLLICVMLTAVLIFGCTPADTESPDVSPDASNNASNDVSSDASSDASPDVSSDEKDAPKTLGELIEYVFDNCLPPLSEPSEPLAPGTVTPVENLRRAPQDLVGQKFSFERLPAGDKDKLLYRYTAETKRLVILLYSTTMSDDNAVLGNNAMLIAFDTEYADMGEFLQATDFAGTVTDISILDPNEFMYSYNSLDAIASEESTKTADSASAVCYGNGETVVEYTQEIAQFEDTMTRFDIQ